MIDQVPCSTEFFTTMVGLMRSERKKNMMTLRAPKTEACVAEVVERRNRVPSSRTAFSVWLVFDGCTAVRAVVLVHVAMLCGTSACLRVDARMKGVASLAFPRTVGRGAKAWRVKTSDI